MIQQKQRFSIPWAAINWFVVSIVIFFIGSHVVTLRDRERFPDDIVLTTQSTGTANTVQANVVAGTFQFNVVPQVPTPADTGTFAPDSTNPVAAELYKNIPNVTQITIDTQTITIVYEGSAKPDAMLQRARRPMINAVVNDAATITGKVANNAQNTLVFTTTDAGWQYGRFVPALIPKGQQEVYPNRQAGESGSALAQFVFAHVTSLEALTIDPGDVIITYRTGAIEAQVVKHVQAALNGFYPRASLQPDLWVFTVTSSGATLLSITPVDTGLPLVAFTVAFGLLELGLAIYFRSKDDKLVRPLVRVVTIFVLFWSIFGHLPLWDYVLGLIFPTSDQLVHPSGTVIQFAAQHLELVIVSSLITIPAGLILGILVTRDEFREMLPLVNNLVNSGQTVPTIAIVAFMAPIIGFGFWPAIIALVVYGLLPVVRNTIAGLEGVDDFIIDSARGMGMTPAQILFQIELPIASSVIMAGVRTSMVINVGTATLGAFVGSGGLGTPIASGLAMTVDSFILLGAIPAALLAILIDYILSRIEFAFTPRGLQIEG